LRGILRRPLPQKDAPHIRAGGGEGGVKAGEDEVEEAVGSAKEEVLGDAAANGENVFSLGENVFSLGEKDELFTRYWYLNGLRFLCMELSSFGECVLLGRECVLFGRECVLVGKERVLCGSECVGFCTTYTIVACGMCWILYYILHTTYYILHTTYYILHTTYYILHTTYYILHTTYYILHTACTMVRSARVLTLV